MYHIPWETKGEGMQGDFTGLLADKEDAVSGHLIECSVSSVMLYNRSYQHNPRLIVLPLPLLAINLLAPEFYI